MFNIILHFYAGSFSLVMFFWRWVYFGGTLWSQHDHRFYFDYNFDKCYKRKGLFTQESLQARGHGAEQQLASCVMLNFRR